MLKRKFADRSDWKRILSRQYVQSHMQTTEFTGYITLLNIVKVKEPLWVRYGENRICIVDDGYQWVQHFPIGQNYSVTSMFDVNGEIVQWYIDICADMGIDQNVPWLDDLFLDIVVLPNGEIILLDEDELKGALENGNVNLTMYNLAWEEANRIIDLIKYEKFNLLQLSKIHKESLEGSLEVELDA